MKINLKKIAVCLFTALLIISLCLPIPGYESGTAHAEESPATITQINGKPCAAREIIIKFKDSSSGESKANTLNAIDPAYKPLSAKNTVKIQIPEGKTLEEYLAELNLNPNIAYAQPNYLYQLEATVNDPFASPSAGSDYQWFHDAVNSFEAWDYTMGAGAIVGVLDTGAYISHVDLGANIILKPDIALDDLNMDGIGETPDNSEDDQGHGTHVSGIIAATGNNGTGGLGIAPQSSVYAYDVFSYFYDENTLQWGWGAFTDDIVDGIAAALADGVDIINMSLGGYQDPDSTEYWDLQFEAAVDAAVAGGVVVVCSAGNNGVSDGAPDYDYHRPSDYDSAISVISTTISDTKASSSNYGPLKDISAPGDYIVSTVNTGSYEAWGGTSMASPMVAGVCALILSANPYLTVDKVKYILYTTADDLGTQDVYDATYDEYRNDTFAFGRVNAEAAVLEALDTVTKVDLDKSAMDVGLGKTGTLTADVFPSTATNRNVTWTSSNEGVATVTGGVVTGVSLGTTIITVTTVEGGYTDTCEVNIRVPVTGVTLDKSTTEILVGSTDTLTETVAPEDAYNKNVTWSSNNETVATVAGGVVTGESVGEAIITVTTEDGSFEASCTVTVNPVPVTGITLDKSSIEINLGETDTLTPTVAPENATNKNVTWSSSAPGIASVVDGVVTGEGKGTATITVTTQDGPFEASCDVTVNVAVTDVSLDKETLSVVIGQSGTLTATVVPENANNKNVTWSSSAPGVATVADGVVTSVSVGDTTITVTTEDGGFTDTCDVSIIPIPADGVTLNKSTSSLYVGASEILKATVSPDDAANKNVTWSSSAPGVVEVDSSGKITAVSAGNATITVTTVDGSHTDTCAVSVSALTPAVIDDTIRVKLSINNPTYIYFYIDGNYSVNGAGLALERQQYHIDIEGTELVLYLGTQEKARGTTLTLVQHEATSGNNFIWVDNYEHGPVGYLGNIAFSISGGTIQAINHVYLEEYLYGVVPHEMSDSWNSTALEAQAVAARSYAAASMGGSTYDVVDTSASQVYKGYDDSDVNSIAAVDATQKKVLQYGDVIKKTYFSASNGGYTDSPLHVWPTGDNMPYAIYEDPYDVANASSPYEKIFFPVAIDGTHPITTADNVDGTPSITNAVNYIKTRILASGQLTPYGVSTINDFELTGVLELVPGTYDTDSGEDHSVVLPDGTNDCVDYVNATGHFTVSVGLDSYEVPNIVLDLHYFDASNGITTYQVFNMSALRLFVIAYEDGENPGWAIYQRRYGHGVGLSQRGTQQRAADGQTLDQILAFYYPYTSRVTLSYSKTPLTEKYSLVDNSNAVVDCNDYLNVRSGPGTGYSVVGTLPAGARIHVTATGTWDTIDFGGVSCYVSSAYVDMDGYVAVTGVDIPDSSITLDKGDTQTLTAIISPSNATNKSVTWSSSKVSVATVNSSGLVTAVGGGTATITVTTVDGSRTDTCSVTVNVPADGVTLDESSVVIYMGKTLTLTATVTPADATDKSVTWSSDNEDIVTIDGGVITPVAEGTTFVTVTTVDGGHTYNCNVTVGAPPTDAIYSSVYTVNQTESLLLGVPDEITITDMVANLDNAPADIVVRGKDNSVISDWSAYAGTGMTVQLVDGDVVDELGVVVLGDVDGNGLINIFDYTYVKMHIFNVSALSGLNFLAGDIDKNGEVVVLDYSYIKMDIYGVASIN